MQNSIARIHPSALDIGISDGANPICIRSSVLLAVVGGEFPIVPQRRLNELASGDSARLESLSWPGYSQERSTRWRSIGRHLARYRLAPEQTSHTRRAAIGV